MLTTPSKMTFVALPRIFGPTTAKHDADDREHDDDDDQRPLRPELAEQAPERGPEALGLAGGQAHPAHHAGAAARRAGAEPAAPAPGGPPAGRIGRPPGSPGAGCRRGRPPLMPRPPPRSAARTRSRGRSRWSSSSSCVPMPTIRPSSRTTIRSACMIVPTRWATMITVAPPSSRSRAARSRASVAKSSAEKLSSKTKMSGALDERAGDREPLALAARDVRAALGDRRLEAALHRRRRSRGPARSRARATARRRSPPRRRSAGCCATVPLNRNAFCGTTPMRAPQVLAVELADVDAVDEHRAAGRVVEARDQVDERRLAAAGGADDGRRLARARPSNESRAGPAPRRPGSGTRRRGTRPAPRAAVGRDRASAGRGSVGSVSSTSWIRPAETGRAGHEDEHEHGRQDREQDLR